MNQPDADDHYDDNRGSVEDHLQYRRVVVCPTVYNKRVYGRDIVKIFGRVGVSYLLVSNFFWF